MKEAFQAREPAHGGKLVISQEKAHLAQKQR